jgi:5-methylcytosine-specific restriction endonuclease McrA
VTVSDDSKGGSAGGGDTPGWPTITMRKPCPCGCIVGLIFTKNGQDTVRCARCNRYSHNAPRTETGRPRRSLRSRPRISPSQRARIILRDGCACVQCHGRKELVIGRVVSVRDGYAAGLTDAQLYCDDNLVALCAECNSGLGRNSIPAHRLLLILTLRARR